MVIDDRTFCRRYDPTSRGGGLSAPGCWRPQVRLRNCSEGGGGRLAPHCNISARYPVVYRIIRDCPHTLSSFYKLRTALIRQRHYALIIFLSGKKCQICYMARAPAAGVPNKKSGKLESRESFSHTLVWRADVGTVRPKSLDVWHAAAGCCLLCSRCSIHYSV